MANEELKKTLKNQGVKLWQIADMLNISEATMTRKMRHELSNEERIRILSLLKNTEEF